MAKFDDILEEAHLKKILTVGGVVALAISASYIVRTYLDYLRVKLIKKQLKELKKEKKQPKVESDENWILEDE